MYRMRLNIRGQAYLAFLLSLPAAHPPSSVSHRGSKHPCIVHLQVSTLESVSNRPYVRQPLQLFRFVREERHGPRTCALDHALDLSLNLMPGFR